MKRRDAIRKVSLGLAGLPVVSSWAIGENSLGEWANEFSLDKVEDEKFWKKFSKEFYNVSDEFINLENGYYGIQPIPVLKKYIENIQILNQNSSRYLRTQFNQDFRKILEGLAEFVGVDPEEILVTRNATESMNIIINGLDLKKGDEVILHKQDYFSMIEAMEMLEKQRGITIKVIKIPIIPENDDQILSCYEAAITEKTKCILTTHMIHLTGQIVPVKKIAEKFGGQGIDIIVDAAHSFAHVDYKMRDLGCDFVGVNLHKWFGNPLGAGLLYVKKNRIADLKPMFGDNVKSKDDINKLGHFGTLAVPTLLTIPAAQSFNQSLTIQLKEKRLRYLQNYWTTEASNLAKVNVTTPLDPQRSCAIASFNIEGVKTSEVIRRLNDEFKVFTVIRNLEDQEVVRVTPSLYNNTGDLDRLLEGIKVIASS